jgi:hypothetical protein
MRFRPANIRLINRRYYLPRLLLALSSNSDKSKDNNKNHPIDVQRLTGHSISGNEGLQNENGSPGGGKQYNPLVNKPTLIFHADWGSKPSKRWCAKAILDADGRYTASRPVRVGDLTKLFENLKAEAGPLGTVFAGFDFPIDVPAHFAERAGIAKFRDLLQQLGTGVWKNFYKVCDTENEIAIHRPFYPNRSKTGCLPSHLFAAHGVTTIEPLLRLCERGGKR